MGKLNYILSILLLSCLQLHAQVDTALPERKLFTVAAPIKSFNVDNLYNIYLINNNNQVKKLNDKGDSVGVYNDVKRYGDISYIDVTSPLKILVYYQDFATVVILDRFLTHRATIALRQHNILQPGAVALSYDNNIWVYDEAESKIKKIDESGNVLLTSNDLRLSFTEAPQVSKIIDDSGMLYLYDATQGWLLFDYYFALKKRISEADWQDVQSINANMIGRKGGTIYFIKEADINVKKTVCNYCNSGTIKTMYTANFFYLLQKDGLSIYDLKK